MQKNFNVFSINGKRIQFIIWLIYRCGRRVSMLIFCVGHLGFGLGVAFSQSFVLYLILRIGVAATTVGTVLVAFVYSKWRQLRAYYIILDFFYVFLISSW